MTGAGSGASPFRFDGLAVTVTAGAAAGDRFMIRPVADTAARLRVAVSRSRTALPRPRRCARAARWRISPTRPSRSPASPTSPILPCSQPVQIRFEAASTFRIYDSGNNDLSGPLAYAERRRYHFQRLDRADFRRSRDRRRVHGRADRARAAATTANALALAQVAGRGFLGERPGVRRQPDLPPGVDRRAQPHCATGRISTSRARCASRRKWTSRPSPGSTSTRKPPT